MALRLLKRGLVGRTTRNNGNKLRRAWAAWRGRTRLLNALSRRLARLATAEARYRLRQAVRDWDRYAQAKILIELDDHGLNAVRFEEARANALRLRRQRSTVRHQRVRIGSEERAAATWPKTISVMRDPP